MPRPSKLTFDRGTLVVHPPPQGKAWIDFATWDDRIERFRIPAMHYRSFLEATRTEGVTVHDKARAFEAFALRPSVELSAFSHQREALAAWTRAGRRGVVVLPTGSGKTYLAQLAMQATPRSTLVLVPTLDLMHQWYAHLRAAFPDAEVGLLGGGSKDRTPILVSTYDSAAIHAETLGNRYGLLVFDECHHLPGEFYRVVAEYAIAPYRLGLTATVERSDGRHADLDALIGPLVYRKTPEELAGGALAEHQVVQIKVRLSEAERKRYDALIEKRNLFLRAQGIGLGTLTGWQRFVQASARSEGGRAAMLAHREARAIAFGTEGKLRVLEDLLSQHYPARTLVFTDDNATVYRISQDFLLPAITHKTKVKERHQTLEKFRSGDYPTLVTSRVLNEGVDVPEASVAVVLSGTGSSREHVQRLGRILRPREGKKAVLYEVIAEDTGEEGVSRRRRGEDKALRPPRQEPRAPLFERIGDDEAASLDEL